MSKLVEHFKAMQETVTAYLTPEVYEARVAGKDYSAGARCAHGSELAKDALVNDLIYMLDGPEQRAAERDHVNAIAGFKSQVEILESSNRELRDKLAVSQSDTKRVAAKLDEERRIGNDLRSRLMDSELAYAKLRGYLEGLRDAEPPRMVPEQREHFHASLPDGSQGAASARMWGAGGETAKSWYHR